MGIKMSQKHKQCKRQQLCPKNNENDDTEELKPQFTWIHLLWITNNEYCQMTHSCRCAQYIILSSLSIQWHLIITVNLLAFISNTEWEQHLFRSWWSILLCSPKNFRDANYAYSDVHIGGFFDHVEFSYWIYYSIRQATWFKKAIQLDYRLGRKVSYKI